MNGNVEAAETRRFRVPVGVAPTGQLVRARAAAPEVRYRCPGCEGPLLLRQGPVRAPHFAHQGHGFCAPETALHQGVKTWIAQLLRIGLAGKGRSLPRFQVPCGGAPGADFQDLSWHCPGEAWQSLADLAFDEVALERATPEGLRPDILLLHQGAVALAIEVRVTHAVDAAKAARTPYPWIELDALRVLAAPRSWRPCQQGHPWTSRCRVCICVEALAPAEFSEVTDPGDYAAQIAAAAFRASLQRGLEFGLGRLKPAVAWRCPGCKKANRRPLRLDHIHGADLASSLDAPAHPQVILQFPQDPPLAVSFAFPRNPSRPWAVLPLPAGPPTLRVTPDLKRPHRLTLNGCNRPLAFVCSKCGTDCIGAFPAQGAPMTP